MARRSYATVELPDGIVVQRYNILTTDMWIYHAVEPATCTQVRWSHSHMVSIDGRRYGLIGTGPLPPSVAALPAWSEERSRAYRTWRDAESERAYQAIHAAFPDAEGTERDGEIVSYEYAAV